VVLQQQRWYAYERRRNSKLLMRALSDEPWSPKALERRMKT
jgi:hypothetical protein